MSAKTTRSNRPQRHIAIIGANFAGLSAAIKMANKRDIQTTLIDPSSDFHWTPNIHEIVSGVKDSANVSLSVEKIAQQLGHRFIPDQVMGINSQANELSLKSGEIIEYDALLVACGMDESKLGIEGMEAHSIGLKRAEQATEIAQRIDSLLASNAASKPRKGSTVSLSIVGAGFTGIELLGELLRRYGDEKRVSINVIEAAPRILSALPEVIADDVVALCKDQRVQFHVATSIASVTKNSIQLGDGTQIASDLTICCAGNKLPEFIAQASGTSVKTMAKSRAKNSAFEIDKQGIVVNDALQSDAVLNIFAAGDIAATKTPTAKQASYAIDMGKHAAKNIELFLNKEFLRPFIPIEKPVLLSFGDINTYFIYKETVLASPLLAPLKEAIYQFYMAQFSTALPAAEQGFGLTGRYLRSASKLFLPQLLNFRFAEALGRSQRLQ